MKQGLVCGWSILWAIVMTLMQDWRGVQTYEEIFLWIVFHVVGVAFLARPLRTIGETLVLSTGSAIVFVVARFAALVIAGANLQSPINLGLTTLIGVLEYALFLSAILLVGRWIVGRLSIVPYLGKCIHCDYDLKGNASGACPECGEAIHEDQQRYLRRRERELLQSESGH
ncbi:MAG: hypothetical protein H6819_11830 [Phycisphaerales bacterium]|nr:hypothetical protein [Phycisphaerales bacterium]MCB9854892.1 hypothetical protein [Phycisphaerales bacterium]MCB9864395.1 hypothetical protein [Phycisphaerales bacterium]